MPFSGSTYTNVSGATGATAGQIVQSAVWNNIHTDLATALTQVMSQLVSGITNRNSLWMNGGFEVWQRGAGSSAAISVAASTLAYTSDRWYIQTGANQAFSITATTALSNSSQLAALVQRNNGQTGVGGIVFAYPLDSDEIFRLRGSKVSFQCLFKAGANWSPTNGTVTATLLVGTGAVGKRNATPYTNETSVFSLSTNLTQGGATTSLTGASSAVVPTNVTQAELQITFTPVGTAGAADSVTIDDVMIEPQLSTATWTPTNFDRMSFTECHSACQRHFAKTFPYGTAPAQNAGVAGIVQYVSTGTSRAGVWWKFPRTMRATPGITTFNPSVTNANWRDITAAADLTVTVDPSTAVSSESVLVVSASTAATDHFVGIHIQADAGI